MLNILHLFFVVLLLESNLHHKVRAVNNTNVDDPHVQSPIAISMKTAKIVSNADSLKINGHWDKDGQAFIENTGSSAKITFVDRRHKPYVSGGLLRRGERYIFEQIHFHWGKTKFDGSEHRIDGESYSMEAHLVHYNEKYGSFEAASKEKDGLVVVAFFLHAFGVLNNGAFSETSDRVPFIRSYKSKTTIRSDCLRWIRTIPQTLSRQYFTYQGSLTTPPYNESVTWIIFRTPLFIAKRQVDVFRKMLSEKNTPITENHRPLQISDRKPNVIFVR